MASLLPVKTPENFYIEQGISGLCVVVTIANFIDYVYYNKTKGRYNPHIDPLWLLSCFPMKDRTTPYPFPSHPTWGDYEGKGFKGANVFGLLLWISRYGALGGEKECMNYEKWVKAITKIYPYTKSIGTEIFKRLSPDGKLKMFDSEISNELIPTCGCTEKGNYTLHRIKNVTWFKYNEIKIKQKVQELGAVAVSFPMTKSFIRYNGSKEKRILFDNSDLTVGFLHSALIVGWDVYKKHDNWWEEDYETIPYWIVKNFWGEWGLEEYEIHIAMSSTSGICDKNEATFYIFEPSYYEFPHEELKNNYDTILKKLEIRDRFKKGEKVTV